MSQSEKLLSRLEELIDIDHVIETESLHKKSLNYEEIPFPPLTLNVSSPPNGFVQYPYIEAFQDPEKMMVNELLLAYFANIYQSVRLKDYYPLGIRSNYGVGIIASMFGLKCKIIGENMPWVAPVDNIERVRDIIENGVPDVHNSLGQKVFDTNLFYKEKLSKFPKCARAIHITQPDMEGPFNIAELMLGSQIYNQLYENPEMIHRLLDLITETYINFLEEVRQTTTESVSVDTNFIYLHGAIIRGRCLLKDDSSINISPDMYREFVEPYNKRIFEEAGGGGIHSCGNRNPWQECFLETPGVMCLDFGDPQMNDMGKWYDDAKARKIAIPRLVISEEQLFNKSFRDRFRTGVSFFMNVNTLEEAQDLLNRYINYEWADSASYITGETIAVNGGLRRD